VIYNTYVGYELLASAPMEAAVCDFIRLYGVTSQKLVFIKGQIGFMDVHYVHSNLRLGLCGIFTSFPKQTLREVPLFPRTRCVQEAPRMCLYLALTEYASCCVLNIIVTGTVYATIVSILTYQHLFLLLNTGGVLHVSTFPRSSSGDSQEYQSKFFN
jgi:hypothetical protein